MGAASLDWLIWPIVAVAALYVGRSGWRRVQALRAQARALARQSQSLLRQAQAKQVRAAGAAGLAARAQAQTNEVREALLPELSSLCRWRVA